jgi:hypothetical protein
MTLMPPGFGEPVVVVGVVELVPHAAINVSMDIAPAR